MNFNIQNNFEKLENLFLVNLPKIMMYLIFISTGCERIFAVLNILKI